MCVSTYLCTPALERLLQKSLKSLLLSILTQTLGMDEVSKDELPKLMVEVLSTYFFSICTYPDVHTQ